MWKAVASNALSLFVVLLFVLGGVVLAGRDSFVAEGPLDTAICFRVESGTNFTRVSNGLESEGAISNARIFNIGVDYSGKGQDLKAGSFLIPAGASMLDIKEKLTGTGRSTCGTEIVYRLGVTRLSVQVRELDPETNRFKALETFNPAEDALPETYTRLRDQSDTKIRMAVAEGITSWQVVNHLKSIDFLEGTVSAIPPEGTLAPDSYEVKPGDDRNDILDRMAASQSRLIADAWENRASDTPVSTPEELVILASIIEKETAEADERGVVASVFANRLKRGMKLQTDPTVIYGITKGQGVLGRGLRRSELRAPTPWNTYVIPALPPTPIANPGRAALRAAADPDTTDFIFFVADGTGGHAFAETLEEHNRNVARWRQIEAERAEN